MARRIFLFALTASLLAGGISLVAQGTQEYLAKVTVLEKVTYYVDWPTADLNRPFVLGVVGRTPFGDELDAYYLKRTLKGRPVRIRYFRSPEDIAECDLLFICSSEKDKLKAILAKVKGWSVLTVGDTPGFAQEGVMLNMVREGSHLVFELNLAHAKDAGLRLAPGLLNLSKIVG